MAKSETKAATNLTVEEKLRALYNLQTVSTAIDKIKILRGELPLEVQDLEDEIAGLNTRIENYSKEVADLEQDVANKKIEISENNALIAKYTEQQNNVRNNKEYDNLSKEIEYKTLEVELNEKRIKEYSAEIKEKNEEIGKLKEYCDGRAVDLQQKREELAEIVQETKQEEERLRSEIQKLEENIEPRLLTAFKRIRKNARNGLAVVNVQRDACGGCFNKIPPQRQLDIKMRKKIIVCEYCGRILVDNDIAGVEEIED